MVELSEVKVTSKVKRQLKNFHRSIQNQIKQAIKELESNPRPAGCLKIENEVNTWRLRVGEYRIAYRISEGCIEIIRAAHRSKFYARKEL